MNAFKVTHAIDEAAPAEYPDSARHCAAVVTVADGPPIEKSSRPFPEAGRSDSWLASLTTGWVAYETRLSWPQLPVDARQSDQQPGAVADPRRSCDRRPVRDESGGRRRRLMARRRKPRPTNTPGSEEHDRVLAGVARRLAEVTRLIQAGRWFAPRPGMDDLDWDAPPDKDDGGLAASGVRRNPPDKSGSGSATVSEPLDRGPGD
jgi:hypothetical protein